MDRPSRTIERGHHSIVFDRLLALCHHLSVHHRLDNHPNDHHPSSPTDISQAFKNAQAILHAYSSSSHGHICVDHFERHRHWPDAPSIRDHPIDASVPSWHERSTRTFGLAALRPTDVHDKSHSSTVNHATGPRRRHLRQ